MLKPSAAQDKQDSRATAVYDKPEVRKRSASDAALAKAYAVSGPLEDRPTPTRLQLEHHASASPEITDKKLSTFVKRSVSSGQEPQSSVPARLQAASTTVPKRQASLSSERRLIHMYDEPESVEKTLRQSRRADRLSEGTEPVRQKAAEVVVDKSSEEADEHLYDEPESWESSLPKLQPNGKDERLAQQVIGFSFRLKATLALVILLLWLLKNTWQNRTEVKGTEDKASKKGK